MPSTRPAPVDRLSHPSFLGLLATQFFGAFNDNLFKQLLLLLAIPTAVVAVSTQGVDSGSQPPAYAAADNPAQAAEDNPAQATEDNPAQAAGDDPAKMVQPASDDFENDDFETPTGLTEARVELPAEPEKAADLQGVATILFGLPFVVFGGLAGYLADRCSKRTIIVSSKIAEIVIMALGMVAFLATPMIGFTGLWIVLFLMGLQSTFFGPGKYGILPEMLSRDQLNRANGLILMTTFVAIIIGTAVAGPLKDAIVPSDLPRMDAAAGLWVGSVVCIAIAVVGVATSLLIVRLPAAEPTLELKPENLAVPREIRALLKSDRPLCLALLASCVFWLIAGLTIQSVNSLGKTQLELEDTWTSIMVSLISVGIAIGGVVAGQLGQKVSDDWIVRIGTWGTVVLCFVMSITLPGGDHLLGFYGCVPILILLGASAAFFAIPIQVFLQARPPEALKGRTIAVMNQTNFFAVVMSGVVYFGLDRLIDVADWPRSALFAAMGILFLPVALFYRIESNEAPETLDSGTA